MSVVIQHSSGSPVFFLPFLRDLCYNLCMRTVIKTETKLKKMSRQNDSYTDAPPAECVSFMWPLTEELWSIRNSDYVKRRLQRDITNLLKKQG